MAFHGWAIAESAREFAAVPVATKNAARSCSNVSARSSSASIVQGSAPYEGDAVALASTSASRTLWDAPTILSLPNITALPRLRHRRLLRKRHDHSNRPCDVRCCSCGRILPGCVLRVATRKLPFMGIIGSLRHVDITSERREHQDESALGFS